MDQGPIGALPVLRPDAAFHPPRRSTLRIVIYIVAILLIVIGASDLRAGELPPQANATATL
jgi:hypothetical protein